MTRSHPSSSCGSDDARTRTVSASAMKAQEQMWETSVRGAHTYKRIYAAGRGCDILFVVPVEQLRSEGVLFSDDVAFQSPEPPRGFLEVCHDAGVEAGWARRALSAGHILPDGAADWVRQQLATPPPSVCKMVVDERVPLGGAVEAVLENGEKLQVRLAEGAAAGAQLLYTLPPIAADGAAEPILCSSFARKKSPRGLPMLSTWQVRWFELMPDRLAYYEVGAEAQLLPRETLPLDCVTSVGPAPTDPTRLELELHDGTRFALRFSGPQQRNYWVDRVRAAAAQQPQLAGGAKRELSRDVIDSVQATDDAAEGEEGLDESSQELSGLLSRLSRLSSLPAGELDSLLG